MGVARAKTASALGRGSTPARPANLQQELGKKRPFDLPEEEAYLSIVRTADQLSARLGEFLGRHGLSEPLYNVLRIVAARGADGVRSQAIAQDMVSRDPDVTRLIDRLEGMGLVRRRRCSEDRRVIYVVITDAGQAKLDAVHKPGRDLLRSLLGHIGDKRLAILSRLLFAARHPESA